MQKSSEFLLEIMTLVSSANIMGIAKVFLFQLILFFFCLINILSSFHLRKSA
jgi:hypothetical protein